MSLINDALKKAQNLQSRGTSGSLKLAAKPQETPSPSTPEAAAENPARVAAPPPVPPPPAAPSAPPPPAPTAPPKKAPRPGMILLVAGAVFTAAFGLVVAAVFLIWGSTDAGAGVPPAVATAPEQTEAPTSPAPATAAPATAPVPVAEPPVTVALPAEPAPVAAAPAPAPPAAVAAAPTPRADAAAPAAPPAVRPVERPSPPPMPPPSADPRIQAFVTTLRVAGIRTGENPKALLNDRVYSIGENVSVDFDLRLSSVSSRSLEFTDRAGAVYELRF